MTSLPLRIGESNIRTVEIDGNPWFVLRDLLRALGTSTATTSALGSIRQNLGEEHITIRLFIDTIGRRHEAHIVTETALYLLVVTSRNSKKLLPLVLEQISGYKQILKAINDFEVPDDLPELYVYAIREKGTGNIKIGISRDPEERLRQLQTGNSNELELVCYKKADNRFSDEKALHSAAHQYHIRGEWFSNNAMETMQ